MIRYFGVVSLIIFALGANMSSGSKVSAKSDSGSSILVENKPETNTEAETNAKKEELLLLLPRLLEAQEALALKKKQEDEISPQDEVLEASQGA